MIRVTPAHCPDPGTRLSRREVAGRRRDVRGSSSTTPLPMSRSPEFSAQTARERSAPSSKPPAPPPADRDDKEELDESSKESFPASDPPSFTPSHPGKPDRQPQPHEAPKR